MYGLASSSPPSSRRRNSSQTTTSMKSSSRSTPMASRACLRSRRPQAEEMAQEDFQPSQQPRTPPRRRSVVCQCCYEEIPAAVTRCSSGEHPFCQGCVRQRIQKWVSGEPYPLIDVVPQGEEAYTTFKALPCLSAGCTGGVLTCDLVASVASTRLLKEAYRTKLLQALSAPSKPAFSSSPKKQAEDDDDCTTTTATTVNADDDESSYDDDDCATVVADNRSTNCHFSVTSSVF